MWMKIWRWFGFHSYNVYISISAYVYRCTHMNTHEELFSKRRSMPIQKLSLQCQCQVWRWCIGKEHPRNMCIYKHICIYIQSPFPKQNLWTWHSHCNPIFLEWCLLRFGKELFTYIYIYMCIYIGLTYAYTGRYLYTCNCINIHIFTHISVFISMYMHMWVDLYTCIHIDVYNVYRSIYTCMVIYVYAYIYMICICTHI